MRRWLPRRAPTIDATAPYVATTSAIRRVSVPNAAIEGPREVGKRGGSAWAENPSKLARKVRFARAGSRHRYRWIGVLGPAHALRPESAIARWQAAVFSADASDDGSLGVGVRALRGGLQRGRGFHDHDGRGRRGRRWG